MLNKACSIFRKSPFLLLTIASCSTAHALSNRDIGTTGAQGSLTRPSTTDGAYTIKGSGGDIDGTADGFHFVYEGLSGDGQITAQLATLTETDPWTKFGVMIRKDLSAGSPNVMFLVRPKAGSAVQHRLSASGTTQSSWDNSTSSDITDYDDRDVRFFKPGKWFRLTKQGNTIASFTSDDGRCWIKRRQLDVPALGSSAYFGVALTSHKFGSLATGTAKGIKIDAHVEDINANCPRAEVDGPEEQAIDYNNLPKLVPPTDYNLLTDYFNRYIQSKKVPGAQLVVMRDNNSHDRCSEDLAQNYGVSGDVVASSSIGWQSKMLNEHMHQGNIFRLASVDKMVTGAIVVEIFKRGLYDVGTTRQIRVINSSGETVERSISEVPFADIPVLSYLRDYLNINIPAYPGGSYGQRMESVTIRHLMEDRSHVREWNLTEEQAEKDRLQAVPFSGDHNKLYMLEQAAFDYGISLNDWEPTHLARWIFSQDLLAEPGTDIPGVDEYYSNDDFLLRFLADSILKAHKSSLVKFMQQDMGLSGMIVTNERLPDRHGDEVGYFVNDRPEDFLDNRPFLDDYYSIGSSAEQLAKYFENYMVSYKWDSALGKFTVDAGASRGQARGAWAMAQHNKCHGESSQKHVVATLASETGTIDQVSDHIAAALYSHPSCSWGSKFAVNWAYDKDFFLRNHSNLTTYLSYQDSQMSAKFNVYNRPTAQWKVTYMDGEYVRLSNGDRFLHTEFKDSDGNPIVSTSPYTATNSSGDGLDRWWTAMWKIEPVSGTANAFRIRNRLHSTLFLSAERADSENTSDATGEIKLLTQSAAGNKAVWSFCDKYQ